jgi:hypothetical protein
MGRGHKNRNRACVPFDGDLRSYIPLIPILRVLSERFSAFLADERLF